MEIRLQTLGPPRCYANGALTDLSSQKLRFAVFLYLSVQRRAARESVVAMFWPERDDDRARRSLAQTLYELRRSLGEDCISPQADPLEVTEKISIDALEFIDLVNAGEFARALSLYEGDFLEGFHLKETNAFDSWLESKRRELKRLYHKAARQHVEQLTQQGDLAGAVLTCQRWLRVDPLDDEANHALIQSLAISGKRVEAIEHFENYERQLRKELDVAPLDSTLVLVAALRERRSPTITLRPASNASAAAPEAHHVQPTAVLGFWAELKQRRVVRVAWVYLATLFVVLQAAALFVENFGLPRWVMYVTAAIGTLAFPLALVLSWQFDLTPEGVVVRDDRSVEISGRLSGINWGIIVAVLMVTATVVIAAFVYGPDDATGTEPLCADGQPGPCRLPITTDPNRFVVIPLTHTKDVEITMLDGITCARLIGDGLSHWNDLDVVEWTRLSEVLSALDSTVQRSIPFDSARSIAQQLGAGKFVSGELWHLRDTARVKAYLYDSRSGKLLQSGEVRFPSENIIEAEQAFNRLAQDLLARFQGLKIPVREAIGTRSWHAALFYDSAHKAIASWDLPAAKRHLANSLRIDPKYAEPNLWLAYVMLWQRDTTSAWRQYARRAVAADSSLGVAERILARGVSAIANHEFSAACERYRELIARDSASFFGWYGLSECLALDNSVVEDATSPSGWSFVTSREEAIRAHGRALSLNPTFPQAFATIGSMPLSMLYFLDASRYRPGVLVNNDSVRFAASPDLVGDTLSLVPYPVEEWRSRVPRAINAVVLQHQTLVGKYAADWAGTSPNSPQALLALSNALERQGLLLPSPASPISAFEAIRRARAVVRDTTTAVVLASNEIRLNLKIARFSEARKLAERALRDYRVVSDTAGIRLAAIAGLIGRPHTMGAILSEAMDETDFDMPPNGVPVAVPSPLSRVVVPLLAYASVGAPADSFPPLMARAHEALRLFVPVEKRDAAHAATLTRAERMLFPVLGAQDGHAPRIDANTPGIRLRLIELQSLLARGDTARLKRALLEIEEFRRDMPPADYAADFLLTRAELSLAVGDTALAIRTIDPFLKDLHDIRSQQFSQPYQPAAIVRLMIMRAELAARAGDRAVARKWARAARDLWEKGDKDLDPVRRRLRTLSRS